jgi:molecular chaperone GrpE
MLLSKNQESQNQERLMADKDSPQSDQSELAAVNETNASLAAAGESKPTEPAVETMPSLEQLLRQAELQAEEHHDAWLRAKADAENIRKRAQIDITNAHKYAIENFSIELLAVMDSLEAALAVENATVENFKSGMELTRKQLAAAFDKFNIKLIDPQGEKFDPHLHQAISTVDSDLAPNTVVQVMQKGYVLNDRVIRPALVIVSKARGA